jgi:hypothetical protein
VLALDVFDQTSRHLLNGGALEMHREPQQITDCEVLLTPTPRERLKAKLLDAPGDASRADVDQPGDARESRQGANVSGAGCVGGRHSLSSVAQVLKELKVSSMCPSIDPTRLGSIVSS